MALTPTGLGRIVRARRTEQGMTQAELAVESGASEPTIRAVETGRTKASSLSLSSISKALGWPADHLARLRDGDSDPGRAGALPVDDEALSIAAKAGRLSPEARTRLMGYLDALLDGDNDR